MVFSSYKAFIETRFTEKCWQGARIVKEFSGKRWNKDSANSVNAKLKETRSTEGKKGSRRPKTVCNQENIRVMLRRQYVPRRISMVHTGRKDKL
jgi:hypothetical protein